MISVAAGRAGTETPAASQDEPAPSSASRDAVRSAVRTVGMERQALDALAAAIAGPGLDEDFAHAVRLLGGLKGRVIVTGMGKSGLVGRKIAATLTSTGTPSLFLHPGEASHGDLGMITPDDGVLALSWSGETTELSDIIAYCRRFGVPLILVTSRGRSTAARAADICLVMPQVAEACPYQLAPTASTTVQAVLGDALAIALLERRGFSASDFHVFHPGGQLGAQLTTVGQLMGCDDTIPVVGHAATLMDATIEMSRKRYGATAVVDSRGHLMGAFTDGDLRRSLATTKLDAGVAAHMSTQPLTVSPATLVADALRIMNDNAVSVLFVCEERRLVGVVHLHDVLRAGIA